MSDRHTEMNNTVDQAAKIMRSKIKFNECVAAQFEEKGNTDQAGHLRQINRRIQAAVDLIEEFSGCWA